MKQPYPLAPRGTAPRRFSYALRALGLLALLLGAAGRSWAQVPAFTTSRSTGTAYTSIGATGASFAFVGAANNFDDNTTATVTLPAGFDFTYQGASVTSFRACLNGWMALNTTTASATFNNNLGGGNLPLLLAPFWEDLVCQGRSAGTASLASSMKYLVSGTAPNRVLTVEWLGMEIFNNDGPNLNFEVKLFETTNVIQYQYGIMSSFDGRRDYSYTYSLGLTGSTPASSYLAQQTANSNYFDQANATAQNAGANGLNIAPESYSQVQFVPAAALATGTNPGPVVPANNETAGAFALPLIYYSPTSFATTYTSANATASAGIAACTATTPGTPDDDVWFKFTLASAQPVNLTLRGSGGYDGVLQLFSDAGTTALACVNATAAGLTENYSATLAAGTYYVRVYHAAAGSGTTGQFALAAYIVPPVPANNECTAAVALTSAGTCAPINGTSLGATASAGVPACVGNADDDVWYSFTTAATARTYTLLMDGSADYDGVVQVLSGACGTLASVSCTNATLSGGVEVVTLSSLTPNTTYYVRVYEFAAGYSSGDFALCLTDNFPSITSFTPTSGPVGTPVTLTGTGFTGASSVSFNGTAQATITGITATGLTVAVPTGATTGLLTVTTPVGTSAASSQTFTVITAPTLTSIAPNPGGLGQSITLTGTNLGSPTALTINGANALTGIISNSGTSLVVRVPVTATASGSVIITTASGTASLAFTVMAPPGNALAFDGTDDYVSFGSPAGLSNLGLAPLTMEAWVYCTNLPAVNSIIRKGGDYNLVLQPGGLLYAEVWSGGTSSPTRPYLQATTAVPVNRWTHVAATWNGTALKLYVNGVDALGTQNSSPINTSEPLQIGSSTVFNQPFNGRLDEVRIYNAALTPANIQADMLSTASAVPASLGLYLNFDQGTPGGNNAGLTTLYDLANAYPGTLTNFALTGSPSNYVESYALVVPAATAATAVSNNTFTANWTAPAVGTVTNYLVDVSTSSTFASAISGSPFTVAAGTTALLVSGQPGGTYYYRVRADKTSVTGQGASSNVVTVVVPSATLSCSAGPNNALNFDGGSDYVHTTGTLPATGEFTLETWVNPTALPGGGNFAGLLLSDDFPAGAMHWQFNGNRVEFTVNGSSPADQFSTFTVPTGSWSHLAVVYSASAKTAKLYLNGALLTTATYTSAIGVAALPYSVGGWLSGGSPQRFLNGSLNELRVWSVARTDAQVLASYNQALPAQTGLAILYSFDQGTAGGTNPSVTTLNDDSGTGHNGTLNTFALTGATSNWVAGNTLAYTLGLTSYSPGSGAPGVSVTLTGSGFTGATAVRFNGTAAGSFTVVNGSTITAVVPAGATTGTITVTGPCGTVTSSGSFTVCALPVAIAQNIGVTLDVNGNAMTTATAVNNGSTANCGVAAAGTLSVSPSSFSCTDAVPATVASALSFNGTNQYVAIPTTATVPVGNSAYTIEAWIKPTSMGNYGIIGWGNYGTTNQVNALRLYSGGLINYWWTTDLIKPTANLAGAWHHVAATFDGTTRTLYLDGVSVGSDLPGSGHAVPTANNLRIGSTNVAGTGNTTGTGEYFSGSIDEVRVWNVARTAAQLNAAKGAGLPGATAGLVAYYRLNEGSGLTTADATGNAANLGTLTNGPTWTTDAAPVTNGSPVTLTVTDAGGNTSTAPAVVTVSVPATPTTTWNGSLSTSPLACQNWSYGQVPDAVTNVVVPALQPRYPTLSTGTLATKDLTINSGGTLTTNSGTTLQVSGSLANSGTATFSGPVQFVGSAATQTLSNASGFTTVVVNKPSGTVQLAQNLTINSALTLTSGTLTTTGSYQVNLGGSAALSESDASYVLGKVVVSRPLVPGTAEAFSGLGLTLTPTAGSAAPGATQVTRTTGTAIAGAGTSQSILRNFDIRPTTNAGLSVTMDFAYFPHELNGIPVANLRMFKSVSGGTPWIPQRGTTAAGNVVTKTGITDFSVWTLGNNAAPLPVELAAFTATAEGPAAVRLAWTTASEKNSQAFDVERSLSGTVFERIGTVAAAGSSSAARSYELLDAKLPAGVVVLYYRLKQVDLDGTFAYSPVRTVSLTAKAEAGLALYPNPAHAGAATLTGALPGTLVTVFDALGRLVTSAPADATGTAALALPAGLPAGVYVVRAGTKAVRLTVE